MSKTLLKKFSFYLKGEEVEKMNEYRGAIPISRIGTIALHRLLDDLDNNRVDLLKQKKGTVSKK